MARCCQSHDASSVCPYVAVDAYSRDKARDHEVLLSLMESGVYICVVTLTAIPNRANVSPTNSLASIVSSR
jgi:hypothetical protein